MGLQQKGDAWQRRHARSTTRSTPSGWVSGAGAFARAHLGPGALSAWTRAFRAAELAIPVLVFFPFAWRITRGVGCRARPLHRPHPGRLLLVRALGWTLAASAALLVPAETLGSHRAEPDRAPRPHRDLRRRLRRLPLALAAARSASTSAGTSPSRATTTSRRLNVRERVGGTARAPRLAEGGDRRCSSRHTVVVVDSEGRVHTRRARRRRGRRRAAARLARRLGDEAAGRRPPARPALRLRRRAPAAHQRGDGQGGVRDRRTVRTPREEDAPPRSTRGRAPALHALRRAIVGLGRELAARGGARGGAGADHRRQRSPVEGAAAQVARRRWRPGRG